MLIKNCAQYIRFPMIFDIHSTTLKTHTIGIKCKKDSIFHDSILMKFDSNELWYIVNNIHKFLLET